MQNPTAPAASGALSREGVSDLLLAALHMGLDPAATQLHQDLDAGKRKLAGRPDMRQAWGKPSSHALQ